MQSLVTTECLAEHLTEVVVVDASWHMPASGRSGGDEYRQAHIPGARFLDIDALSDGASPLPHMLPDAASFGRAMERLGVDRDDRIVVYDASPLRTAARGWFMLRYFGAEQVAVLDGGFQKWVAEGRATESGEPQPRHAVFAARTRGDAVVGKADLLSAGTLLDARGRARFEGGEADPRPGVAPGHVPGSRNLPYASLYNHDGTFRSPDELRRMFAEAGVDPAQPFVATCGSGVTANSLIFAAHLLGNDSARLYDGSWSEWGACPTTPKAVGPA
jgi:thiosulfate/3-mercaptopyruvate sulfurtransferase